MLLTQLSKNHSINMVGSIALGAQHIVTSSLCLPYKAGRDLLLQTVVHPMPCSNMNLWHTLNLVILVWLLSIRLRDFLIPGWWSAMLIDDTFPLALEARC